MGVRASGVVEPSQILQQDSRVSLEPCAFTSQAAYAAFEEEWRGELRPGQVTDLTVFDGPLDTPEHIVQRKVLMTIVAGRVVYDARTAEHAR
jgi:predicted amidohydrolase YtcJ